MSNTIGASIGPTWRSRTGAPGGEDSEPVFIVSCRAGMEEVVRQRINRVLNEIMVECDEAEAKGDVFDFDRLHAAVEERLKRTNDGWRTRRFRA